VKIVVTNDDGIDAPGIETLARLASEWGEVYVVAPDRERSGMGHSITSRGPVLVKEVGERRWSTTGTPVDCVRIGLKCFAPDADWVLSGINRGGNLGIDVYMSGTVGAAREAAIHGFRAIALSQLIVPSRPFTWELVGARTRPVLKSLFERPPEPGHLWNVNVPHPDHTEPNLEIVDCEIDTSALDFVYDIEGDCHERVQDYHARPRKPGLDVHRCMNGEVVTVSAVRV